MELRSFLYGLMAHLLIGWAFFALVPLPKKIMKKPLLAVQIHLEETPAAAVPAVRKAGKTQQVEPRPTPASVPAPPRPATAPVYTDLLPKAARGQISLPADREDPSEPGLIPGHQFKPGSSGVTKQNLVVDASTLSAALDVPLLARRNSTGGEAFLRLDRVDARRLKITDLRGDPMLRAVIFENLQNPKVRALLLKLMDELKEDSLPLTLQAVTRPADRMQDELDFTWIGRRLIIRKAAPPVYRAPLGAIALPDEDAKKAVIRDRLEYENFQRSPAYRSAIQNQVLP